MNQVIEKILQEIRNSGAISFARFMECALYCPVYGYYEKEEDTLGRRGDYYTSISVGPLFGELLAQQFSEWLEQLRLHPRPQSLAEPLCLVEAGAHQGQLAKDILAWFRAQQPSLFEALEYWIVEPSVRRRERQRRTLSEFLRQVRWASSLAELRPGSDPRAAEGGRVRGVIFSNELLDAMPVHRLGWDSRRRTWFEWGVTYSEGRFRWKRLQDAAASLAPGAWPRAILEGLPDGFTAEVCPSAERWWANAAGMLQNGYLLTIDYGLTDDEYLAPERTTGTLRSYRRHQLAADVLADPGDQDITAHVNFSTLRETGEREGLKTDVFCTQEQFLTRIAAPLFRGDGQFREWASERIRQFQTLTHPNHLGRSFRVLVQLASE